MCDSFSNSDLGPISASSLIQQHIYEFDTALMGSEEPKILGLAVQPWLTERMVSAEENNDLCLTFLLEELDQCPSDTKTNTAPVPDGFTIAFFKKFWPLLKDLVLHIINGFVLDSVDIARLNFVIISLILKIPGEESIKQ